MGEDEDRALGELVLRRGYISMEQLHLLLLEAERSDRPLAAILLKNQLLTPDQLDEIVEQLQNPSETSQLDSVPVEGPTPVPPPPPPVKIPKPNQPPSSKTKVPVRPAAPPAMPPRSKPVPTVASRNTKGVFKLIVALVIIIGVVAAGYFYVWPIIKAKTEPPPPPPPSDVLEKMYYEDDSSIVQDQIEKSFRVNPKDPEAFYWQGRMALRDHLANVRFRAPWTHGGKVEIEPSDGPEKTIEAFDQAAKNAGQWKRAHRMPAVEGIRKLLAGKASDAVTSLKQALDASEDDPEIRVLYALALYYDAKFDEAMAEAKRRVNSTVARVTFARASHGAGLQRPTDAADLFASGLKMLPKEPSVTVLTARVELLLAQYELLHDESLQQAQDHSAPLATMEEGLGTVGLVSEAVGRLREEQGIGTQAIAKYQNAIDLYGRAGKSPAWNVRRAFVRLALAELMRKRGMGAALTMFKDAEREFRAGGLASLAVYCGTQLALLKAEKPFDKVQAYEKQISDLTEPLWRARARLEFAKFESARGADASALFQAALADAAADPWLKLEIQREQARAKFEPAPFEIPSEHSSFDRFVAIGDTFQLSGELRSRKSEDPGADFDQALKAYDEALKQRPESVDVQAKIAATRLLRARHLGRTGGDPSGDEAEAVKIVDAALKRSVESGEMLLVRAEIRLGFAGRADADLNAAIADATDALKISPTLVRAFTVRAMAQIQKGILNSKPGSNPEKELTEAIADCASALKIAEGYVDALWQRGKARVVWGEFRLARSQDPMNDLSAAVGDLSQSLRLRRGDPFISGDRAHAFSLIGKFRLSKGQEDLESFKKCADDATAAIEKTKTDPTLYFDRGRAMYYLNKFEACVADLEEAKKLNPKLAEEADTLIALAKLAIKHGGRK